MVIDTAAIIAILRGEPEADSTLANPDAGRPPRAMLALRRLAGLIAIVTVTVAASPAVLAQPYRYVGEDGVTVYSQTQPAGGAAAAPVEPVPLDPAPPPGVFDAARERLRRQLEAEVDAREAARKAVEASEAEAGQAAARKARCEAARQNRETVSTLGARMLRRADGTIEPVGDAERVELIREAEQQMREFCD